MPHRSKGYFYYEYIYESEWDEENTLVGGKDDSKRPPFHTAYYTEHREDHQGQTAWYANKVRPAIEADCKKIIDKYNGQNLDKYPKESKDRPPNRFNRVMKPFSWKAVKEMHFYWTEKLPTTTEGERKGQPYGREI
ncbi:hypothetical protein EDD37DRAFT_648809 [Exophiala viscosa]|uniref:Uncharacterized protein n=1 Tax=Exophiala viscosa TaxID=2486360 RepID=A0AAN6DW46_9EURO|nr:hypothetical protein EDD36DRAFT_465436 [Exophiala viscosa]KAI1626380.1 hypothetical protein EDD37DRAFT_648809 [Exophiala viscosa]